MSDFKTLRMTLGPDEWDSIVESSVEKYAAGQARDSHGRFASGHTGVDAMRSIALQDKMRETWKNPVYNKVSIGSKMLPSGWDYVPAKKGAEFLSNYLYGTAAGSSFDKSVAKNYYADLASKGQLEIYKHSSGMVFTVEREDVNLPEKLKFDTMQLCADMYKGNKSVIAGNMLVRMDTKSVEWRQANGYAGDSRHGGAIYNKGETNSTGSTSTNSKMIALNGDYLNTAGFTNAKLTIAHEFGHIISYDSNKYNANSIRRISLDKMYARNDKVHFTDYSRKSSNEWYAETFATWVANGGKFDKSLKSHVKQTGTVMTLPPNLTDSQVASLNNFASDQGWKMPYIKKG